MNELAVSSVNITTLAVGAVSAIIALMLWFALNRASVRANEHIRLLNALLEQQKQQTELLLRLTQASAPSGKQELQDAAVAEPLAFKNFIAER